VGGAGDARPLRKEHDVRPIPAADPTRVRFTTELIEQADAVGGEALPLETSEAVRGEGLRHGNRISFGDPAVHDLAALWRESPGGLPQDLRRQSGSYEFWLLRLVCTLHPSPGSAVDWFELHIALGDVRPDADPADPPLVYDLYPTAVTDRVEVRHTAKLAPSLEFMAAKASLGEDALTLCYQRLEPRITAFGRLEQEAYWRFAPGAGAQVSEGIKEVDLVVRRRRGARVQANVTVKGRGRWWGVFANPPQVSDQRFEF
jgi:hypothetical protein